jgi:hypothetical protein
MAWAAVAGAAVSVAGGMISGSKARKAQKQQDMRKQESADAMLRHSQEYGNQQIGMANEYQNFVNRPGQITNGYGTSMIDPSTGQMRFDLNSNYAGLQGQMFDGARKAYTMAGDFNPQTHAAERYASAQALLAPSDAQAESGLMMDLYNKGGFGLNVNRQAAPTVDANGQIVPGSGNVGVNPYASTFMNARNTRNAGMAWDSQAKGEAYLDNLINRAGGLFKSGAAIDEFGRTSMNDAMHYRNQFNSDYRDVLNMQKAGYDAHYAGVADKYAAWAGGDPGFGANNQSQQWAAGGNQLGGMIKGMDFSKLFGGTGTQGQNWGGGAAHSPYAPMAGNEGLF